MAGGDRRNADSALVTALAAGLTNQQAAKQAGVSESTVARRLREPAFREQVAAARSETVARTAAQLTAAGTAAVRTLLQLLDSRSDTARLGAARAILEMATSYREGEQLEARLRALEQQQAQPSKPPTIVPWRPQGVAQEPHGVS